jgi:ATP adenylyltransferase
MPMNLQTNESEGFPPPGSNLERLWTPWRSAYVGVAQPPGCFLCALQAAPAAQDRQNLVLLREPEVFLLLNRFPYSPGHLLVAPREHTGDLASLADETRDRLFALAQRAARALQDVYRCDGLNVGMNLGRAAGAGVPDHLHVHVLPRWSGDTNFMTVIGETRVLPESLEQTWERLRPSFAV